MDGFAVNTVYSENMPRNPSAKTLIPSQSAQTIGDLLTHAGISWKWYSEGFQMALQGYIWENSSQPWFSYENQPFLYYDRFSVIIKMIGILVFTLRILIHKILKSIYKMNLNCTMIWRIINCLKFLL